MKTTPMMEMMMQQHRLLSGLEQISVRRQDTINELLTVCSNFIRRFEEEKEKIVSLILPVAILVSASRKVSPNDDPHDVLKKYRYHTNPNAENIIILSKLFDLWEYTENIKAMITEGAVPDDQIKFYQNTLSEKLLEKEEIARDVDFATLAEIDQAFAGISNYDEGE